MHSIKGSDISSRIVLFVSKKSTIVAVDGESGVVGRGYGEAQSVTGCNYVGGVPQANSEYRRE